MRGRLLVTDVAVGSVRDKLELIILRRTPKQGVFILLDTLPSRPMNGACSHLPIQNLDEDPPPLCIDCSAPLIGISNIEVSNEHVGIK